MISVYFKDFKKSTLSAKELATLNLSDVLWIDLTAPTLEEQTAAEKIVGTKLLTRQQAQEIETTSKYWETPNDVFVNIDYYIDKGNVFESEPLSMMITRNGLLLTYHQLVLNALEDVSRRMTLRPDDNLNGYEVFMTILESVIDYEADMEELLTREISRLSRVITSSNKVDKPMLHRINELQEKSTGLREDVYDVVRVLNSVIRNKTFPEGTDGRVALMIKDAESLMKHGDISFARLDYMQDTAMGLITIQQNEIVKILSVAAVIFMPPTLIASIYGMNFKLMPELDWTWPLHNGWIIPAGYFFALVLMVVVSLATYWFFKLKKWL